jgi:transcriptional regulator with XRE-family HTH domain
MHKKETFGEVIRKLREQNAFPIRKVAAELDIDPSTLSKIERNERSANKTMIAKLSALFNIDATELMISFLSDKVAHDLAGEKCSEEVLKVAEEKIKHIKTKRMTQGRLTLD